MTPEQRKALQDLCERYRTEFIPENYYPQFDLPQGYVAGWVGPPNGLGSIYVGCSPTGEISS